MLLIMFPLWFWLLNEPNDNEPRLAVIQIKSENSLAKVRLFIEVEVVTAWWAKKWFKDMKLI